MRRQQAESIGNIYRAILENTWLGPAMMRMDVFNAWENAVGMDAARATERQFFKDGVLFVTLKSSVLRSHLYVQRESIRRKINSEVSGTPDAPVKSIVLK